MTIVSDKFSVKVKINDVEYNIDKYILENNSMFFKSYFEEFDVTEHTLEEFVYDIDQQTFNDIMNYFKDNSNEFKLTNHTNEKMLIALYLFDYFQFDKAIDSIKNNFSVNKKNMDNSSIDVFKKYIYNDNIKDIFIANIHNLVLDDKETEDFILLNEIRNLNIEIITLTLNENSLNYLKIIKDNFKNIIICYDGICNDDIFYEFIKRCNEMNLKENNIIINIYNATKINMYKCIKKNDVSKYKEYFFELEKLNKEHVYYDELLKEFIYDNFDMLYDFFILIKDNLCLFEDYSKIVNSFDLYIMHQMNEAVINKNVEKYKKYFLMRRKILTRPMTYDDFIFEPENYSHYIPPKLKLKSKSLKYENTLKIYDDNDFLSFYNFIKSNKDFFGNEYNKVEK